jgi:peptide/nickel transport system substrate-binding protein
MSRKLWLSLGMVAAGAVVVVATGLARPLGSDRPAAGTQKGGTLRLSGVLDYDSVDPAVAYLPHSWSLEYATCAKLFNFPDASGPEGRRAVPEVVQSTTVSRDERTYTFDLKRTYRFNTGAFVTAHSFADAFNRDASPKMQSAAMLYMHDIAGADAVNRGKAQRISGVRVLGRYRLQIRLTKPLGDLIARLTMPFFCPIPGGTPFTEVNAPAGSGPYYVADRASEKRTVLRRNPYYPGGRVANVDEVVFTVGESKEACLRATEQDAVDHCVFFGIPATAYRELAGKYGVNRPGGQFFVSPRMSTFYFAFNQRRRAFKGSGQIALKKAINYAIDRRALASVFGFLGGTRTDQMLPPELGRNERFYPLDANPATARKWYARARYKPRTLVVYANKDFSNLIVQLSTDLKRIGIGVKVKYFDQLALGEKANEPGAPYDILTGAWSADYADGASYFELLLDGGNIGRPDNLNYSFLDDPRVNARIASANRLSGAARRKAWADLDADLMRNDPPWAPYFHTHRVEFVSPSYGCFVYHAIYGPDLAAACKK